MSTTPEIPLQPIAASILTISIHEETDAGAWDRFLATQPRASFYHLSGWRSINQDVLGHRCFQLAARSDGHIVGALPLVLVSSPLFGRILCSMPFVNFGGPCADDRTRRAGAGACGIGRAKRLEVDYLELRCARAARHRPAGIAAQRSA